MADLASLEDLKEHLAEKSSDNDTLMAAILNAASDRMKNHMRREIVETQYTSTKLNGTGRAFLFLPQWPIATSPAPGALTDVNGDTVDTDEYSIDSDAGLIVRVSSGTLGTWAEGYENFTLASHTAGFDPVPPALEIACRVQAASMWQLSGASAVGGRLGTRGTVLDEGGSAQFLVGPWAQGVLSAMEPYVDRRFV